MTLFSPDQLDKAVADVLGRLPDNHDHAAVEITTTEGGVALAAEFRKVVGDGWLVDSDVFAELRKGGHANLGVKVRASKEL